MLTNYQEQGSVFLKKMPCKGKTVLDAGCGNGWAAVMLKEMGAEVHAADLQSEPPKAIADAGIRYTKFIPAYADYDFIWCSHVLEHIQNPIEFLYKLRKIGRTLWLALPKASGAFAKGHINNYDMPTMIEHLKRSGWDVENGSYNTYPNADAGNLWAAVNSWGIVYKDSIDDDIFHYDEIAQHLEKQISSPYPPPMDALNSKKENHLRNVFHNWNWEKLG